MSEINLDITRGEAKLLRKLIRKGPLHLEESTANLLLDKGLVEYTDQPSVNSALRSDEKYTITNDGKLAYEQYFDIHDELRRNKFISYAALIISLISLLIAALSYLSGHNLL